jgi:glycosyltransferase involved in cell wall biosynthesis
MRILVNDFGGYPFPAELSRELADRGNDVTHAWCASLIDTPGSAQAFGDEDHSASLDFVPLDLGGPLDKYRYVKRLRQERRYGRLGARLIERLRPDVVLAANMPLDAQRLMLEMCRLRGIPFVFWLQDLIGPATGNLLRSRLPVVGGMLGHYYTALEARLLRESTAVVAITDDFRPYLERCRVEPERITTVENWAPLAALPVRPKRNPWAISEGLAERFVFAYTGALGMKQDPDLLLELASHYRDREEVCVMVCSGGPMIDYLARRSREAGLANLDLRGFVPWPRLPDVLGAADVVLASIHSGAGRYSVPSKVMAYLCSGRPLMLSVPRENLAGRIVDRENAGLVVEPGDLRGFLGGGDRLLDSPEERARMGRNARRYAESAFAIGPIADRFERVLSAAVSGTRAHSVA